jgi:hypothetical protein
MMSRSNFYHLLEWMPECEFFDLNVKYVVPNILYVSGFFLSCLMMIAESGCRSVTQAQNPIECENAFN